MQVTSTTTTATSTNTGTAAAATGSNTLNYDAFLQLLVAELRNQDPTKPMDSAQYMGQLASFSSVEQSVKVNAKLDTLIAAQTVAQAEGLIGRTVSNVDGSVSGVVQSVRITDSGAVAVLEDGTMMAVTTGLIVSATAPTAATAPESSA